VNTLEIIQSVLKDIAYPSRSSLDDLEYQLVMDSERHHYQVVVWAGKTSAMCMALWCK
jgi:hypothetical protein